jgi:nucleoside-diphosphate-sugar epimerase
VSRAQQAIGFSAKTALPEGLKKTVEWYEQATAATPPAEQA